MAALAAASSSVSRKVDPCGPESTTATSPPRRRATSCTNVSPRPRSAPDPPLRPDRDTTAGPGEANRVLREVVDCPLVERHVHQHLDALVGVHGDRDARTPPQPLGVLSGRRQQVTHGDRLRPDGHLVGLQPGDIQQVQHHVLKPVGTVLDVPDDLLLRHVERRIVEVLVGVAEDGVRASALRSPSAQRWEGSTSGVMWTRAGPYRGGDRSRPTPR